MVSWRGWRRRAGLGLPTVLGLAERGFFIPYRYAQSTRTARRAPAYPAVEAKFGQAEPVFKEWLDRLDGIAADLEALAGQRPPEPRWEQDWFPRLDGAVAYAMIRTLCPKRLIEVGSGHSTRFFVRAAKDEGLALEVTAIDPAPRADIAKLPIRVVKRTVQEVGIELFTELQPGDILSIDSSHILMPGTDVDILFGVVLPALPDGVIVHVHDIFLPDDYPEAWRWRGYNEQLAIVQMLVSGDWQPLFSSHFVVSRMASELNSSVVGRLPLSEGALESSLWLGK